MSLTVHRRSTKMVGIIKNTVSSVESRKADVTDRVSQKATKASAAAATNASDSVK